MGKKQRNKSGSCRLQVGGHAKLDKGRRAEERLYSGCMVKVETTVFADALPVDGRESSQRFPQSS